VGLTALGAAAVRRMNRLGVIVDVAHCTKDTVKGVARVATRAFLCSHANLTEPGHPEGGPPRSIGADYARMVAESGGVIGAFIAPLRGEGLPGMIRQVFRLIDAISIDHAGIGTDLPVSVGGAQLTDFARHPEIARGLRDGGLTAEEVAKVCAGNWLRVFRAVRGTGAA
jgi:membrane dipeptidase